MTATATATGRRIGGGVVYDGETRLGGSEHVGPATRPLPNPLNRAMGAGLGFAVAATAMALIRLAGERHAQPDPIWLLTLPVAAGVVVAAPGVALAVVVVGRVTTALLPGIVAVGAAGSGLAQFWCWWLDPALGRAVTIALPLVAGAVVGACLRRSIVRSLAVPLALVALISVAYGATAFDRGTPTPDIAQAVSLRYWASVDNKLPELIGIRLHDGVPLRPEILGDWQSSDRPPLAIGTFLSGYGLGPTSLVGFEVLVAAGAGWILGLWSALRSLRVPENRVPIVVFAAALCGPVFVNTVYTWPKITAATLGLVALAAIWDDLASPAARSILAAAATTLALLCHGSAAFAALALIPFVVAARKAFRWRHALLAAATIGSLYLPWVLYQRLWDPPGDRLLLWHLAGTSIDEPDTRPFLTALWEAYREEGVLGTIGGKLENLRVLADPTHLDVNQALAEGSGPLHRLRAAQLSRVVWAPGVLLLAVPLAIRQWRPDRALRQLLLATAATASVYVLVEWGNHPAAMAVLHTAPLTVLLLPCAALALATLDVVPRYLWSAALAVCMLAFGLLWWWPVGQQDAAGGPAGSIVRPIFLVASAAYLGAAGLVLIMSQRDER